MAERPSTTTNETERRHRLPWFVNVSPEFYDEPGDTGYGWEGWATDDKDAIAQALEDCHLANDRDPEDYADDVDPDAAKVHVAEIDFRRFAGPLLHWAKATGNAEAPIWKALERAVIAAKLDVAPFELIGEL
jgi:hypothetical protein